jgi:hypothetical protein
MLLPIEKMTTPTILKNEKNGMLADSLLVPCGIGSFKMLQPAARAMRALVATANAAGFNVHATGTYRSYAAQQTLFLARYSETPIKDRPSKIWKNKTWWLKPKMSMAAVPGTSNHGWALAIDFAEKKADGSIVSVSPRFVSWLCDNAKTFGYSAEDQSEVWHWRHVAGDNVTPAVIAFENGDTPQPAKPERPVLRTGSTGTAVRELQTMINALGYDCGKVDGKFGPRTTSNVRAFQKDNPPLKVDGIVGAKTWSVLEQKRAAL